MREINKSQLIEIGEMVSESAQDIFVDCQAEADFCIQSTAGYNVVFGSTNRLLFSPIHGFSLDLGYCTKKFITLFNELYK